MNGKSTRLFPSSEKGEARREKRARKPRRKVKVKWPLRQPDAEHWPLDEYQGDLELLRASGWRITISHRHAGHGFTSVTRFRCTHARLVEEVGVTHIHLSRSRIRPLDVPTPFMTGEAFLESRGGSVRGTVPPTLRRALKQVLQLLEARALRAFLGLRECRSEIVPPPPQAGEEGAP